MSSKAKDSDVWACACLLERDKEDGRSAPSLPIEISNYSSLFRVVNVLKNVLLFANKLCMKVANRNLYCINSKDSYRVNAMNLAIRSEQYSGFKEEITFLSTRKCNRSMPPLVAQMNLYLSEDGLLRVKSKFGKQMHTIFPVLLPKTSHLTDLIILNVHQVYNHCGAHQLLRHLRAEFYVLGFFSLIRKLLKRCIVCRRFNARTIKLNQSDYRSLRVTPIATPFANIYIDYAGPFIVKLSGTQIKVWLLVVTCMWCRAINICICRSADTVDFLKAMQLHVYEFGIFSTCVSDLGTQLKAGANMMKDFLSDSDTLEYFELHNVKPVSFANYPKGNSSLGSLVEVCVKQVKLLIKKSIRNNVLEYFDFEHLVMRARNVVNKRPIAFKSNLSTLDENEVPLSITPEMLIKGYETCTVNIVPHLHTEDADEDNSDSFDLVENPARAHYVQLRQAKERLEKVYHEEFLCTLISQAVDKKDRYRHVHHEKLQPGDIVLLVEPNTKRSIYPMGRVHSVEVNDYDEVTAAYVFKGKTRERVYRHVNSLILLLSSPVSDVTVPSAADAECGTKPHGYNLRSRRTSVH